MTRVAIHGTEWYPVYAVLQETDLGEGDNLRIHEVDDETLARWEAAAAAFGQAQREMSLLANPRCPECGHPIIRHQEWSSSWDNWGCLDYTDDNRKCRCRYGCPPERLAQLEAQEDQAWRAEHTKEGKQ